MAQHRKLFGDGMAARRIASVLQARHATGTVRRPMATVSISAGDTQAAA
jgi:hypothetical protein